MINLFLNVSFSYHILDTFITLCLYTSYKMKQPEGEKITAQNSCSLHAMACDVESQADTLVEEVDENTSSDCSHLS